MLKPKLSAAPNRLQCGVLAAALLCSAAQAASPGLPFTEDFANTALRDSARTTANWDTDYQQLLPASSRRQYCDLGNVTGTAVGAAEDTWSVILGDVDGDGDLDLLKGNMNQANRLFLNNGTADPFNGVAGTAVGSVQNTTSLVLGDVDGDGDLDLLAGNYTQVSRLFLNNGTADPFNGVTGTAVGSAQRTHSLALGDVDGDGDLDLVQGNDNEINSLFLNNGTADPFNGVVGIALGSAQLTRSLALGDVDGDGDLDLVQGNYGGDLSRLFLNNGTADPFNGVAGTTLGSAQWSYSLAMGDVDGDGDLDVIAGDPESILFLNNGTSDPFESVAGTAVDANQDLAIRALGDMDGDGDLDLVTGNFGGASQLFLNDGTAHPFNGVAGTAVGSTQGTTLSVALGDVDGDGDLDFVEGNFGQATRLFLNNCTTDPFNSVTGTAVGAPGYYFAAALGELDGDGDLDLIVGDPESGNVMFLNNGTADPFNGVTGVDVGSEQSTFALALGDVDGDGDLDLVEGNYLLNPNRLFLNNGTADPFNGVAGTDVGSAQNTLSIALGDVDGDGDLDLVQGNDGQASRLFLNNGTADPFNGMAGTAVGSAQATTSVVLGDVDDDGDLDLVQGNDDQVNRLFLNNGTADPFNAVTGIDVGSAQSTRSLVLGDVDGDGDLDLVEGIDNQANRLFLNNGTGDPFNGVAGTAVGSAQLTTSLALGDVDGDGNVDLLEGNDGMANRLFLNNGTADPFNAVTTTALGTPQATTSLVLGDVDSDGDLDLVEGIYNVEKGGGGQANRLFLNRRGPTPFHGLVETPIGSAQTTWWVALGDVDGDGDTDLMEGNKGQANRLFQNNDTADPFNGIAGIAVGSAQDTRAVVLGDVDSDGDLDLLEGNEGQANRLFLNNGTADPFSGVAGTAIAAARQTLSLVLGDIDRDGDLDFVEGNFNQASRLFLNNGTANPFNGVAGTDVGVAQGTIILALGDVDGDGDLDLVQGNYGQANLLFLNDGSADPFNGNDGTPLGSARNSVALALGDVDSDGDLDLLEGNYGQANRVFLNNGTADPFDGVSGTAVGPAQLTTALVLSDIDGDGDLDILQGNGNINESNALFLNNGTSNPFNGVSGIPVGSAQPTTSLAVGDVNGDGWLDLVAGNQANTHNFLLMRRLFNTVHNRAASLVVDTEAGPIPPLVLSASVVQPDASANSAVEFYLSNNNGARWYQVKPNKPFTFPTPGSDLRWRTELRSLSPLRSPLLQSLTISAYSSAVLFEDGFESTPPP